MRAGKGGAAVSLVVGMKVEVRLPIVPDTLVLSAVLMTPSSSIIFVGRPRAREGRCVATVYVLHTCARGVVEASQGFVATSTTTAAAAIEGVNTHASCGCVAACVGGQTEMEGRM